MMATAIEIKNLSKTYPGRTGEQEFAINRLNISFGSGQLIGLIGRTGAGKSTLLRLIAGLEVPNTGLIKLPGNQNTGVIEKPFPQVHLLRHRDLSADPKLMPGAPVVLVDTALTDDLLEIPSAFLEWAKHAVRQENRTVLIAARPINQDWGIYDRIILMKHGNIVADLEIADAPNLFRPYIYRIRIKGAISKHWQEWFSGCTILWDKGETILTGQIADQAALHGLLTRIRDLGLPLISINRAYPELEEALQKLLDFS